MIASIFGVVPWYVWALVCAGLIAAAIFLPAVATLTKALNAALGMVPALVWAVLLVFALGAAGVEKTQLADLRAKVKSDKQAQAVKDAVQAAQVQAAIAKNLKLQTEAQNAKTQRDKALKANADSARTSLYSLRDTTSRYVAKTTTDTCPERIARTTIVFNECAAAITELADKADRLNSDRLLLIDSWPK